MEKYLPVLRTCPLFFDIRSEDLLRMLSCLGADVHSYEKKETIIAEGSPATRLGIVLSGSAQNIQFDYEGNRSLLDSVSEGEIFAETFACAALPALPVAVVAGTSCVVMFLDCRHILHTCQNGCGFHQQLIYNLMKDLAHKTVQFHQKIEILARRTTREKLLTYLNFCAKEAGSRTFTIPFDRQELADYLEVDRSGLSVEISRLRAEGILENSRSRFTLLAQQEEDE